MLEILKNKSMIMFILLVFGFAFIDGITNTNVKKLESENIQIVTQ